MFTIEQIKTAHAKVKTGADFPNYISEIKALGVESYEFFVADGHTKYNGAKDFAVSAEKKWAPVEIAPKGNKDSLENSISIHQHGQTDYLTFCRQAAEAGIEKWIVNTIKMTCNYYDTKGNLIVSEPIPAC